MFIPAFCLPQTVHIGTCLWVSREVLCRSHHVKRVSLSTTFTKQVKCVSSNSSENDDYEKLAELFGPPLPKKNENRNRPQRAKKERNDSEAQNDKNILSNERPRGDASSGLEQDAAAKTEEYENVEEMHAEAIKNRPRSNQVKRIRTEKPRGLPSKNAERVVIPEEKIEEENEDIARNRAQMYEEMEQLLGPPEGRFQRHKTSSEAKPKDVHTSADNRKITQDTTEKANTGPTTSSPEKSMENVRKEAITFEEEYELLEANLRAGKPSNKPRRGRKPYPSAFAEMDKINLEPWRVDYNLMPKKGLREKKPVPTKKASKRPLPEVMEFSLEGIIQSYEVLEKILHDEEKEWNEEQEELRVAEEQKRLEKQARRKARRETRIAEHAAEESPTASASTPATTIPSSAKAERATPVGREETTSIVDTSETATSSSASETENKSTPTEPAGALKVKHPPHLMLSERQGKLGGLELKVIESRPPNFLEGVTGLGFPEMHNTRSDSKKSRTESKPGNRNHGNSVMLLENPKLLRKVS